MSLPSPDEIEISSAHRTISTVCSAFLSSPRLLASRDFKSWRDTEASAPRDSGGGTEWGRAAKTPTVAVQLTGPHSVPLPVPLRCTGRGGLGVAPRPCRSLFPLSAEKPDLARNCFISALSRLSTLASCRVSNWYVTHNMERSLRGDISGRERHVRIQFLSRRRTGFDRRSAALRAAGAGAALRRP